jgi:hypothetical protein
VNGKDWYKQQLQLPEWKAKRREIFSRDAYACVDCSEDGVTVHCHHLHYIAGKRPWEYHSDYLVTVCKGCHDKRHRSKIIKFESETDAELWYIFADCEAELIEEELKKRDERIMWLENRGAIFDVENRYWGFVDQKDRSRFYDEDGNPL